MKSLISKPNKLQKRQEKTLNFSYNDTNKKTAEKINARLFIKSCKGSNRHIRRFIHHLFYITRPHNVT